MDKCRFLNLDKCRFCGLSGLVLSKANADYSCEHCGQWQNALLNSVWEIVGYEGEGESAVMCGDCLVPIDNCVHKYEYEREGKR